MLKIHCGSISTLSALTPSAASQVSNGAGVSVESPLVAVAADREEGLLHDDQAGADQRPEEQAAADTGPPIRTTRFGPAVAAAKTINTVFTPGSPAPSRANPVVAVRVK